MKEVDIPHGGVGGGAEKSNFQESTNQTYIIWSYDICNKLYNIYRTYIFLYNCPNLFLSSYFNSMFKELFYDMSQGILWTILLFGLFLHFCAGQFFSKIGNFFSDLNSICICQQFDFSNFFVNPSYLGSNLRFCNKNLQISRFGDSREWI